MAFLVIKYKYQLINSDDEKLRMPIRFTFSFFLLFFLLSIGQAKSAHTVFDDVIVDTIDYKCPPCGCDYENDTFDLPGVCPACGMTLVPLNSGIAASIDQSIAPLFYSSILIKLYNKVLYPIFLVSIIFTLFFLGKAYLSNNQNIWLLGIILILSLYGFKSQLYGVDYQLTSNVKNLFFPISLISLLGPFLFFYVKSLIAPAAIWRKIDYLHFVPAFVIVSLYTIGFLMPEKKSVHFMASPFEVIISQAEQIWSASMGLLYLYFSIKMYEKWNFTIDEKMLSCKAWVKRFIMGMSMLCSFWITLIFLNYWLYNFGVATISNYPLWIAFGITLTWLSVEIFLAPALIAPTSKVVASKPLTFNGDVTFYKKKLEALMKQEQLYKDQQLSLEKLGTSMGLNPRHLSSFLNQVIGKNFYELINFYRIEAVKKMLHDSNNQHLTIEAIAQQAGFKTKSTFNAAFKKQTSMTPRQFMKQQVKKAK